MTAGALPRLARLVVVASMLLAVGAGLWPLQAQPFLLALLAGILVAAAALARWHPALATAGVFAFAYCSYGAVRWLAGPDVASMPFFLAGFVGLVLGTASWHRWEARSPWRLPLAWWAIGVAITWPYAAARDLSFSFAPSLAAGPVVTTALLQMAVALWMDRLLRMPARAAEDDRDDMPLAAWHLALILSALATAAAAIYQQRVDLGWLSGDPWVRLGRAVGLMGDANPMGVATALWAPLTISALATTGVSTAFGVVLSAPLWLAAWASGARTTLLLFGAGAVALTFAATGAWGWSRRRVAAIGAMATAVLLAGIVVLAPSGKTTPVERVLTFLESTAPADAAYELLWSRNGYGIAAVEAIREHPLAGVGIGRFSALSTAYYYRVSGSTIPPDNAQNLWRQTLAEQGLLGLLPLLWLTALTARSLFTGHADGLELVMRVMLIGLGASLLVGYPVQDPAIAVTLGTMVGAVGRRAGCS